jgi:hypothetical protein
MAIPCRGPLTEDAAGLGFLSDLVDPGGKHRVHSRVAPVSRPSFLEQGFAVHVVRLLAVVRDSLDQRQPWQMRQP